MQRREVLVLEGRIDHFVEVDPRFLVEVRVLATLLRLSKSIFVNTVKFDQVLVTFAGRLGETALRSHTI